MKLYHPRKKKIMYLGTSKANISKTQKPLLKMTSPTGAKTKVAVEERHGNWIGIYSETPKMDMMMTPARPDHAITRNVDDHAEMTHDVMIFQVMISEVTSINSSSELLCNDVARSICENTHPRVRDLGHYKRTCEEHCLESNARPKRHKVHHCVIISNTCTKCIQLGLLLCLIIISNRSVLRVTAISSCLYFHRLFLCLFYRGELRYCLYFNYRFFYSLYKVQMMESVLLCFLIRQEWIYS
ncbi:hypothetical protein SK128_016848 [Halocaridina rubra]|uniref:Uncharacterized protein n=1 Tax=Halocaridina rubra TaxID=373956 RepID=A0AAN9A669_HALRR